MWTVKQTPRPTLSTKITAGIADNFIPSNVITPSNCIKIVITLKTTNIAAHIDNNKIPTNTNAAPSPHANESAKHGRKFIYCSQNINGIP